jgi:hypothetical protein
MAARQRRDAQTAGRRLRIAPAWNELWTARRLYVAVRGGLAADRRAPPVSAFPFSEILENGFPHKKNSYKESKNLRKFLRVGNQIWNTFHH